MRPDLGERLAAIPWAEYETAYGNAAGENGFETASGERTARWGPVPEQLLALASGEIATAMELPFCHACLARSRQRDLDEWDELGAGD